jgi:hypothetical protein
MRHELTPRRAQQAFIDGPAGEIFFLDGKYAFGFVVEAKFWLEPVRKKGTKHHKREHRLEVGMLVRGRTSDCIGFDADEYCNLWQIQMNQCTFRVAFRINWFRPTAGRLARHLTPRLTSLAP